MERNELPFGTQFTPNVVDLRIILQLIKDNEGAETGVFIDRLVETFFLQMQQTHKKLWPVIVKIP